MHIATIPMWIFLLSSKLARPCWFALVSRLRQKWRVLPISAFPLIGSFLEDILETRDPEMTTWWGRLAMVQERGQREEWPSSRCANEALNLLASLAACEFNWMNDCNQWETKSRRLNQLTVNYEKERVKHCILKPLGSGLICYTAMCNGISVTVHFSCYLIFYKMPQFFSLKNQNKSKGEVVIEYFREI